MVKKDALVYEVRERLEVTKGEAVDIVDTVLESIIDLTAREDGLKLSKFGVFEKKIRAARKGKHPQTQTEIDIPESATAGFRPLKGFKDAVK